MSNAKPMFRVKMSSLWFWVLIITFEILLISLVGYTLISFQTYNRIEGQLQSEAKQIQNGKIQPETNYLIIDQKGQIQQGSSELKSPIPSSLTQPKSIPDKSVVYDDLYAYRLQSLGQTNNYLITYRPYKKNNPWPERIVLASGVLITLAILLVSLSHILNNTSKGSFAIS